MAGIPTPLFPARPARVHGVSNLMALGVQGIVSRVTLAACHIH